VTAAAAAAAAVASASSEHCTLDRVLCRSSALLFDDTLLVFGEVCFFSIRDRPFFSLMALLFGDTLFVFCGEAVLLATVVLQASFVLRATGLEMLVVCFELNQSVPSSC